MKTDSLEWVLVNRNRPEEMEQLRKQYRYSPLDLTEVLPPLQRPKVIARDGYLFLILLYPLFDPATRDVRLTEVDFFISADRLVTVNVDGLPPLRKLFDQCRADRQQLCLNGDITHLLYAVLNELTMHVAALLVHLNADLDSIEERLFQDYEHGLIQELLLIKTNIVEVRRSMQAHEHVIRDLMRVAPGYFPLNALHDFFDELATHLNDIWQTLDLQKEVVDALHETNRSLIDYRINEIIKTLTIFSVIMFPLTLMAAVFGMNVSAMPIVSHPQGFWIILAIMFLGSVGMLAYFKSRKWI